MIGEDIACLESSIDWFWGNFLKRFWVLK